MKVDFYDSDDGCEEDKVDSDHLEAGVLVSDRYTPTDIIMDTIVEVSEENDTTEELDESGDKNKISNKTAEIKKNESVPEGETPHFTIEIKKKDLEPESTHETAEIKPKKRISGPVTLDITDDFNLDSPPSQKNENFILKETEKDKNSSRTKLEKTQLYIPNPNQDIISADDGLDKKKQESGYKSSSLESVQSLRKSPETDLNYFDFPEIETFEKKNVIWDKQQENKRLNSFDMVKAEIIGTDKNRLKTVNTTKTADPVSDFANPNKVHGFTNFNTLPEIRVKTDDSSSSDEGIGIQDSHSPKTTEEIQNTLNLQKERNKETRSSKEPGRRYVKNEVKVTKQKTKSLPRAHSPSSATRPKPKLPESLVITTEPLQPDDGEQRCETPGHSVKMMAQFWEKFRREVEEERNKTSPTIRSDIFILIKGLPPEIILLHQN